METAVLPHCHQWLALIKCGPDKFLLHFIDESWTKYNTSAIETVSPGESTTKNAKMGRSTNRNITKLFWDNCGVIHIINIEKRRANHLRFSQLIGQVQG